MNRAHEEELARRANAAIDYVQLGWPILPVHGVDAWGRCTCRNSRCDRGGKHPARKNFKGMATTDATLLRSYWRVIVFNLALLIPPRVVVLDFDDLDAFSGLQRFGPWPITPTATTSRGLHAFHTWPLEGESPTVGGLDRSKLDVRGSKELCTLSPSVSASGHRYAWRAGESPFLLPLAPLPIAFALHVRKVAAVRANRRTIAIDATTLEGALRLAHQRASYAVRQSNGVGRGASGLRRTLVEVGASPVIISAALDVFRAEAGR